MQCKSLLYLCCCWFICKWENSTHNTFQLKFLLSILEQEHCSQLNSSTPNENPLLWAHTVIEVWCNKCQPFISVLLLHVSYNGSANHASIWQQTQYKHRNNCSLILLDVSSHIDSVMYRESNMRCNSMITQHKHYLVIDWYSYRVVRVISCYSYHNHATHVLKLDYQHCFLIKILLRLYIVFKRPNY